MNGGTTIIPDLDSIAEFRVLTNNFDAEFGNYSGGIVNVITKSGANQIHGSGFEFLRNTGLDARNFYTQNAVSTVRTSLAVRSKARSGKTRFSISATTREPHNQGIDTGLIAVPSLAERSGDLSGIASQLTGTVSGSYIANILTQRLAYGVTAGEPYYTPGCTSNTQCVFPNAIIPSYAWSAPARHLLQYIPTPNVGPSTFSTGAVGSRRATTKEAFASTPHRPLWHVFGLLFFDDLR